MNKDNAPEQLPEEVERGESAFWLDLISKAEKHFGPWQDAADNIDKLYSELSRWRGAKDREFALFWANMEIMAPSIYARPPVPVVTPKFKDRRPVYRVASEFLERACSVAFDLTDINAVMMHLRDDLALNGRGVAWVRYESDEPDEGEAEHVCVEYLDRSDFLHDHTARTWREIQWVARRAWLDDEEMRERFGEAANEVIKPRDAGARVEKTGVWEIWSKPHDKVIWVTSGAQKTLDEAAPHLKLKDFFPCPRPAYGTLQRRTLVPVPDMVFYKDQLEEVNDLTRRIHSLSWAIKVRGFYAGGGEIGEAIERAIKLTDDETLLIPIPALQALMQGGDPIIWMPIEVIAQTITGLIELRRQVIDDVYQIIGLSDIMRGATQADETLGAQQLKQQNGSVRLRDKQNELIRVARDLVRITAEVMAEEFDKGTLTDMAQMDIPTRADIQKQIEAAEAEAAEEFGRQVKKLVAQAKQSGQPVDPATIEQQAEEIQGQIEAATRQRVEKIAQTPSLEDVTEFLRDEKLRPFVLDIETDSTIYPDEMAEKASRAEFLTAFSSAVGAVMPLLQAGEAGAVMAGGMIKFALAPFRVGRELEGMIDDFVDQAPAMARAAQEAAKGGESDGMVQASLKLADAEMQKARAAVMAAEAKAAQSAAEHERKVMELTQKADDDNKKFKAELATLMQKVDESAAKVRNLDANTQKTLASIGQEDRQQDREDVKAAAEIQSRQVDQARADRGEARAGMESDRDFIAGREDAAKEKRDE